MLFENKYPEAKEDGTYEHGNYIWVPKADNCYMCGKLTHFVELNAGCHMCSEECDENFYWDFWKETIKRQGDIIDF